MKKRIVIIGASVSQNPLIEKAKQMGYETHVFAWKTGDVGETTADYFYPISIMDIEAIYQQCLQIRPSAVATIASDHAAIAVQLLSERLGLSSNSTRAILCMTNKIAQHKALEGIVPMADYFDTDNSHANVSTERLKFPCIVKPSDRTGGRGISKVFDESELMDAIGYARDISLERKAIVEEYLYGTEYSCEVFTIKGKHNIITYTRVIKQNDDAQDMRHLEYVQPVYFNDAVNHMIEETVQKTLDALGYENGPSHIEFVVCNDKVAVLEVSPSVGGDGIGTYLTSASTGLDYTKLVLDYFCGNPLELLQPDVKHNRQGVAVSKIVATDEEFCKYQYLKATQPSQFVDDSGMSGFISGRKRFDRSKHGYYVLFQPVVEMGSFLPLELPNKMNPFDELEQGKVLALNSYRTAVLTALKCIGTKTIYVPHVYNNSVVSALNQNGYEVVRYHVGENLLPCEDLTGKTAILMNYFGIMDDKMTRYVASLEGHFIIDNSLAYFAPHIEHTYSVYVCTRFLGVTNGAYLVGDVRNAVLSEVDVSHNKAGHLLKSLELGTAAAYKEYYTNEQRVGKEILGMSTLTKRLLKAVDYAEVRERRIANYAYLQSHLESVLPGNLGDCVPQCFPFVAEPELRDKLLENKVFVPYYFRKCAEDQSLNHWERRLVHQVHCLPVDQRYDIVNMEYIIRLISTYT